MLKVIIIVLLIGVIVSLFSGLFFLFKDAEKRDSRRTLHALGVRVTLAAALLATVFYGFYTGQLRDECPLAREPQCRIGDGSTRVRTTRELK